jgi:uncharacterized protein (DUF4415 family)
MSDTPTGKTVKFTLDTKSPSALSPSTKQRLATMPDEEIDFSDIPSTPEGVNWTRPNLLVPTENKQQVTLRVDADVLNFFRGTGKRYQSRINAALREYMNAHTAKPSEPAPPVP